ncbi:MAG: RimK family alpha-L-glutamate ligase [Patescibacteria group bacterium]
MTIGILIFSNSNRDKYTSVQALEKAALGLGHKVVRLYEPLFTITVPHLTKEGPWGVYYEGTPLPDLDVIIARPNFCHEPALHKVVLSALQKKGYTIINGSEGLFQTKNKLEQHAILSENKIPMPRWAIAHDPDESRKAVDQIRFPCVIKVAFGTLGTGVFYAENLETFSPIVDYLNIRDGNPVIIQEFIRTITSKPPVVPLGKGDASDIRAFVLGGKVIASMQRTAPEGEIRSNIGKGAKGESVELSQDEKELAIHATKIFNLDIAGVDILRSDRGPLVIEVNSNPGFEELENATQAHIAEQIIRYSIAKAS